MKLFVTGTDTDVGKTIITRALVRALKNTNKDIVALKPVESGAPEKNGRLVPMDATALAKAAGNSKPFENPFAYAFKEPVSPHLAAQLEGVEIETPPIEKLLKDAENAHEHVVAEGAGGLLVPLSDQLLYADLIAQSGFELLIVAPNVLGTINATLLTVEAARARKIPLAGVVLNRTPRASLGNAQAIARHGKVPILGEFPDAKTDDDDELAAMAAENIELNQLL